MKGKKAKQTLETKGFLFYIWVFLGKQQQKKEEKGRKERKEINERQTERKSEKEREGQKG